LSIGRWGFCSFRDRLRSQGCSERLWVRAKRKRASTAKWIQFWSRMLDGIGLGIGKRNTGRRLSEHAWRSLQRFLSSSKNACVARQLGKARISAEASECASTQSRFFRWIWDRLRTRDWSFWILEGRRLHPFGHCSSPLDMFDAEREVFGGALKEITGLVLPGTVLGIESGDPPNPV
jgi:hypothetical protein